MIQYDAGPGDRSDRSWEDPERKPRPQAKRRRVTLPLWALLSIVVVIVILLCLILVWIVGAIRGDDSETTTPSLTSSVEVAPSATVSLLTSTPTITPTNTVVLSVSTPPMTAPPTEIGPGALAVISGTGGIGLRLRALASTVSDVLTTGEDGTVVTVLEGPVEADGHRWWKVRTPEGVEGWAAANWLILKTEE